MSLEPHLRRIGLTAISAGFDPRRFVRTVKGVPTFLRDAAVYHRAARNSHFRLRLDSLLPVIGEESDAAGCPDRHYFHQDLWAARKVYTRRPARHLDVGSRIDGFVSHLLVFMPVVVVDIRPLPLDVKGLTYIQDDAMTLASVPSNSVESLSSLHAVEHIGLGRYGDPIDPDGCFKAMESLARVLAPGGSFYFSVPVGVERVQFNAERVFAPRTVLDTFVRGGLTLSSFSAVTDSGLYLETADFTSVESNDFACGLFEFRKEKE